MVAAWWMMSLAWAQDPEGAAAAAGPTVEEVAPAEIAPPEALPVDAAPAEALPVDAAPAEALPAASTPVAEPAPATSAATAADPSRALLRRRATGVALTAVGMTFASGSLGFGIAGLLQESGMAGAVLGAAGLIHVIPGAIFLGAGIPLWATADHQLGRSMLTVSPVVGPGRVGVQGRF